MEGILALLIPILALSIPVIAIWTSHQRKMAELQAKGADGRSGQDAATIRRLEERVGVLERIITDKRTDLSSEIEALRDSRG